MKKLEEFLAKPYPVYFILVFLFLWNPGQRIHTQIKDKLNSITKIYVTDITGDISAKMGDILASGIRTTLLQHLKIEVFTYKNLADQLKVEQQKEILRCEKDTKCIDEVVSGFGISAKMFGDVKKMKEGSYFIDLSLTDRGKMLNSVSRQVQCKDEDCLIGAIRPLALELFGIKDAEGAGKTYAPYVPAQGTISSPHVEKGEIAPEAGYLVVEGNPKGSLVVISGPKDFGENGKVETSMPFRSDAVPAGNYKVRVSYAGYDDFEKSVRVTADSTETIKIELVKSTGTLIIEGEPRGAKVEVNGPKGFSEKGGLPVKLYNIPRGTYRISVSRDGYENFSEDAEVQGGKQEIVKVNLKKRGSGKGTEAGDMVYIPAGEFWMGCSSGDGECQGDEKPLHKVYLDGYNIDKHEVTVGEFRKFATETGYKTEAEKQGKCFTWDGTKWAEKSGAYYGNAGFSQTDEHPVVCISWNDAKAYCEWAGKRLPTEAEWEKAARGGTDTKYPWGNEFRTGMANCDEGYCKDGYEKTSPVGSFKANGYGLFDMIGNVWEWVSDWYDEKYYQGSAGKNPSGPSSDTYKVLRGGSWNYSTRGTCGCPIASGTFLSSGSTTSVFVAPRTD